MGVRSAVSGDLLSGGWHAAVLPSRVKVAEGAAVYAKLLRDVEQMPPAWHRFGQRC
jgi:hypothetical protein